MSTDRIRGKLGDDMVDAALHALEPDFGWTSGNYGIKQPLEYWRRNMRRALEAAFEALLEDPRA